VLSVEEGASVSSCSREIKRSLERDGIEGETPV